MRNLADDPVRHVLVVGAGIGGLSAALYRDPVLVTLGRFPKARESDSTWRTKEVRHVGSDTFAP
jgi:cation diffusion facilitator CzcD-associated flavoprotein CzcO